MNSKNFLKAVQALAKEKALKEEEIFEMLEQAMLTAYRKDYKTMDNVKVKIDRNTGEIKINAYLKVVEDNVEKINELAEIKLSDALKENKSVNLGDEILLREVTPKDFGRVAATTAKQVLTQKVKEKEREMITEEFQGKENEMVLGKVEMQDERNYFINLGKVNGILPKTACIPGETIDMGKQIKVYITKVENNGKHLGIFLSRTHFGFVKALFESEIPEVMDGTILIHAVAREAGERSKVVVSSTNSKIDPIGACVGEKGQRIATIITELAGEKIDIVKYDEDEEQFIANALLPARNLHILINDEDEAKNEAIVIADPENFPLAIGKRGINVRLASRVTKYHLDIKNYDDAAEMGIFFK